MKEIIPIEHGGQKVLTRQQLAALLECKAEQIRNAIRNHRVKFVKGVHYFELTGAQVSQFRNEGNNHLVLGRNASQLNLLTQAGVKLILQLFSTPEAHQLYAELEQKYFTTSSATSVTIGADMPEIFNHPRFGDIRVLKNGGTVWFVAVDVCRALEIDNARHALTRLNDDEKQSIILPTNGVMNTVISNDGTNDAVFSPPDGLLKNDMSSGLIENRVNVVNEPGLYHLIFTSRKPEAVEFQRWVYHEVLPTLRKQGYYAMQETPPVVPTKKKIRSRPEFAHTYGFLMDDTSTKIGYTSDISERIKRVERDYKLKVIDEHHTPKVKLNSAIRIERYLHDKFARQRLDGEFFSVDFEAVKAELDKIAFLLEEEIIDVVSEPEVGLSELDRTKLLVEMLNTQIDSPFKEKLAKETANLLFGEKIF